MYDAGWGEFLRQLAYKAAWAGKTFHRIDRFFPSSQLHMACGTLNDLSLSDRLFECPGVRRSRGSRAKRRPEHQASRFGRVIARRTARRIRSQTGRKSHKRWAVWIEARIARFLNRGECQLIDEIGKMECLSSVFVACIERLLSAKKLMIATVSKHGDGFIEQVKRWPGVELWEIITLRNRNALLNQALLGLRNGELSGDLAVFGESVVLPRRAFGRSDR